MQNIDLFHPKTIDEFEIAGKRKFLHLNFPSLSFSFLSLWFPSGSRHDPRGKEGLAHFVEHLFMNRTKRFSDRMERLKHLESKGIEFNAITTFENLYFYHIQPEEVTTESFDILLEGMHSITTEENVEKEREIVLHEEQQNRDNPWGYIWRLCQKSLWPSSPLSKDLFGNRETISSLSLQDVKNFCENFLTLEKATFITASNGNPQILKNQIAQNFFSLDWERSLEPLKKIHFSPPISLLSEQRDIGDVIVAVNFRTTSIYDTLDQIILNLIREYLANHWISRFIEKLRFQNDLTYWVSGESASFSDTGYMRFLLSIKPEKINRAIKLMAEEIQKVREGKINEDYLRAIKTAFLSMLRRRHIDPYDLLSWYGTDAAMGTEIISLKDYIEMTEKITLTDIKGMAEKYLRPENFSLVTLGPISEKEIDISGFIS